MHPVHLRMHASTTQLHVHGKDFKKWQEYTEELYQQDLDVPDNSDNVVADLEPGILESEVKWALESMANNKASGGDGIPN